MNTQTRLPKLLALVIAIYCILPAQDLSAVVRRKKIALAAEPVNISEAFYDKAWRDFQIGTKKEKAEVIKSLRAIVKKNPEEFMAHYYLGIMISQEGSPTTALRHLETALLGFPKSSDIHIRLGELLDARNKSEEAIEHFKSALALEPGNGKALARLGMFELENGNLKQAYDLLYKARQIQPDNPDILRGLGGAMINLGSAREAIEVLEQALLFDQKHAETHWQLAKAYEGMKNAEKAAEHYELARKLGRSGSDIKELIGYDLARNLMHSGKPQEAEAEYKKEIRKNADPATGYNELGQLYEDIGREDDAVKSYLQAYNANKKFADGIMRSAEIYLNRDDFVNAENFLNMLRRDPKFSEQVRTELEEISENRKLQESLKLEQKLDDSSNTDADIEETYYKMISVNKNDPVAVEGLMEYYKERGYYDQALYWFRQYNKISPTTDYNKKVIEKDLKNRLVLDNYTLFGWKLSTNLRVYRLDRNRNQRVTREVLSSKDSSVGDSDMMNIAFMALPFKDSRAADDNLENLAFNGENDRLKEVAFYILLTRKEYKKTRKINEGLLDFYTERGRTEEALKCVATMKRLGFYSDYEAAAKRDKLRGK
ncbi:MAG: tetratricopeptide repeat protein [Candidatus Riflebacteria bacterium]|nr:tetratricopeptide repeat protein [Candidatus Riflebacteria bacterium]